MIKLKFETLILMISFITAIILGIIIIPILRKLKVGQIERDDGPQSHLKKQGTPTMGGIMARTEVKEAEASKSEMLKI